jgi:hypothetical protein
MDEPDYSSYSIEDLKREARRWKKIFVWVRTRMAEEGFEVLPSDIKKVVLDISLKHIELTQDNLLREVLGDKYYEWKARGCKLGDAPEELR